MSSSTKDAEANEASSSEDDSGADSSKNTGRKRTLDGKQTEPDDAHKLEARRAYNRQCAAKARKRNKDLVAHLQNQVEELTKDKAALKRANEVMRTQLELLEQQNRTLMMSQLANQNLMMGGGLGMAGIGMGGIMQPNLQQMALLERLQQERTAQLQALQSGAGQSAYLEESGSEKHRGNVSG